MTYQPNRISLMFAALLASATLTAQAASHDQAEELSKEPSKKLAPAFQLSTQKTFNSGGHRFNYQVTAADTILKNAEGEATASIFATSYRVASKTPRPITFIFNGGPGSSSVWLHLGLFGPKRVVLPDNAQQPGSPPYPLVDNSESLLIDSDLVFIDPVGTGYSKALGKTKPESFWGVRQDAQVLAQFIKQYVLDNGLSNVPKYLAGESYGTTRAGALVRELQEGWGSVDLNGVILISAIMDFQTGDFTPGNDVPNVTFLPTYAATAWYHQALPTQPADLPSFLQEVRQFAEREYLPALFMGDALTDAQRTHIADKLHQYTGLPISYLQQAKLRIEDGRFTKELLRDRGLTVGRLDSRYLGQDEDLTAHSGEADPSSYAIDGAYTATLNHYFYHELGLKREEQYQILSGKVWGNWQWSQGQNARAEGFVNVMPHIARAMRQNPDFRVFVGNGYFDLATPFYATEVSFRHYGLDQSRISMHYYDAGHMMYVQQSEFKKLATDIRQFIRAAKVK